MVWKQGDVASAFADIPSLRVRAADYISLIKKKDQLLDAIKENCIVSDQDRIAYYKFDSSTRHCASQLIWGIKDHAYKDDQGNWQRDDRLVWGNFCENNFCPICQKKKSVRLMRMLNELLHTLDKKGYQFFHMVLSDRSVKLRDLSTEVERYNKSYKLFYESFLKKHYDGAFVSLEYTVKYEDGCTYVHPHFHVLLAASPERCSSGEAFINWEVSRKIWARSLRIPFKDPPLDDNGLPKKVLKRDLDFEYLPFLSVYKVWRGDKKVFTEITKYITDFDDLLSYVRNYPGQISFADLYNSLRHKSLNRGSGVLRFSSQNLHFVQLDSSPDYSPDFFVLSELLPPDYLHSSVFHSVRYVVDSSNDIVRFIDSDAAPVKSFISTYVKYQSYIYGYNFSKQGKPMSLPYWWHDLSYDPWYYPNAYNFVSEFPKFSPQIYSQFTIFDDVIDSFLKEE